MTFSADKPETLTDIQELLQRLSLTSFEAIGNYIPAGIIVIGANQKIIYANNWAIQIFGFNPCGLGLKEYALNMAKARNLENTPYLYEQLPLIKALLYGKTTHNQEIIIQKHDQNQIHLSANATPLTDKEGNITGALAIFQDITESKKAEEALQSSERLYRTIFDNNADGFQLDQVLFDDDGKPFDWVFLKVNHAYEQQTGLRSEQVVGKRAKAEVSPDLEDYWIETLGRVVKSGKSEHIEHYNGSTGKWYDGYIFRYAENQAGSLFRDITERKKTEEQLKQRTKELAVERKRFFSMLEDLPVMVCLITSDYKIPFANRMFREKFGEAKGRCCYEYIGGINAPCPQCQSLIPLKTGKPHHWTASFPDGTVIDAHDYPFTDVDGTKMILEADVDITERVNLQKQLREKERLAAIGATAGMVGHDIRNPLQAIMSDTYLLKDELVAMPECKTKEGMVESIDSIEKNVAYINKIVADLQDYSKQLIPEYSMVDLHELVMNVFRLIAIPEDISTIIEIAPSLRLNTDPTLLQRILTNLIINAAQAMPKGGKLRIGATANNCHVTVTVADTGVGIPEHVKPKLFTPMMTTKAKGQGLGLAVVKKSVEALGGSITFESQEGEGTKFLVNLPISR